MTKYWITKYALSDKGKIPQQECEESHGYAYYVNGHSRNQYKLGRDAFLSYDEAEAAVLAARNKKIASLEKQIHALRHTLQVRPFLSPS